MMNPFKSRSPIAQLHYARHVRKQIDAGNPFATKLMVGTLIAACEEWYFDARTNSSVPRLLHVEMDLLTA
jgi:hypothetical protein